MKDDSPRTHWSRRATVYQIYPMSFKDSNGDGKGDLQGIIDKADYLTELGVGAVWICPFFKSPMADFGYDIEDYTAVDPSFGTMEIFEELVLELHRRDIKIIIDFVGNHTSVKHPWFAESRSSRNNPKRDWYVWRDPKPDGSPPNAWISIFGGSIWELDKSTGQYYLHSFLKEQPDLNWHNADMRAAMMEVIDFWVRKGVDGFRIDALQHFLEDDKFDRSTERQNASHKKESSEDAYQAIVPTFQLKHGDIRKMEAVGSFIGTALEKHPDIFIIGEVYMSIDQIAQLYTLCPNERFAPFNFSLVSLPWNARKFKELIDNYQEKLSPSNLPNYTLGNHDIARIATRFGQNQALLAAFLQFTLPGMPFVYYGDELGMTNGIIAPHLIRDVLSHLLKGLHPGRDLERTPMQWDDSLHAGFSEATPWLPVTDNYKTINVKHEKKDPDSAWALYRSLIRLRNNSETLRLGEYTPRASSSPNIFSFERSYKNERYLIIANFGDTIEREMIPRNSKDPHILFTTHAHRTVHMSAHTIELMPFEGYVVKL